MVSNALKIGSKWLGKVSNITLKHLIIVISYILNKKKMNYNKKFYTN